MGKAQELLGASVWLFADRFLRLGLSFAVGILIARHYGPQEFGQISFLIATAGIFGSLSSLGLDDLVPKDLAKSSLPHLSQDEIQHTALTMRLIGGLCAYLLFLVLVLVIDGLSILFFLAAILGPYFLFQATDIYEYRLRVDGQFSVIARTRSISSIAANLLKLLVIWAYLPITFLAATMTAEYGLNAYLLKRFFRRSKPEKSGKFRADYARHLIGRSWKVIIAGLLLMLQSRIEYFLVEHFLGWNNVGQYAVALKIVELFDAITVILVTIMLPEFARKYEKFPERTMRQAYLLGCTSVFILVPFMVVAIWIFPFAYGEQFDPALSILPLFMLRPLLIMFTSVRNMLLVIEHRLWFSPLYAGIGAIASLILGLLIIPTYGLLGAVITAILSLFLSTIIADSIFNRRNLYYILTCWHELRPLYRKFRRV